MTCLWEHEVDVSLDIAKVNLAVRIDLLFLISVGEIASAEVSFGRNNGPSFEIREPTIERFHGRVGISVEAGRDSDLLGGSSISKGIVEHGGHGGDSKSEHTV